MNKASETGPGDSLLEFPCTFPLKVMGRAEAGLDALVAAIVQRHVGALPGDALRTRASSGGAYVAITVTFEARSRAQLDALYTELSAHEHVLMVL